MHQLSVRPRAEVEQAGKGRETVRRKTERERRVGYLD